MGHWLKSSLVAAVIYSHSVHAFRTYRMFATKPYSKILLKLDMKKQTKISLISQPNKAFSASPLYLPRGENQEKYVQELRNPNTTIVVGTGPAGCGKTLFAGSAAAEAYLRGEVERIIITRPTVSVEENLGFLPGNIQRKMDPWLQPLFDTFLEFFSQKDLKSMMENQIIEISPLGFMRGRTFKHCFVLADEMQNSSPGQMLMLLTRIGEGSKLVVTGDEHQSDLPIKSANGLSDFLQRLRTNTNKNTSSSNYIQWVKMTAHDVERSPAVRQVLRIYEKPVENDYKIREYKLIFNETREKMSENLWACEDPPPRTPRAKGNFLGDDIL